jgi:cytochrome b561
MLCIGFFKLAGMSNADPQKIDILRIHMAVGMSILGLMTLRFIVRICTRRPADATTGYAALDRIAPITHCAFYLLVLLMAGSDLATAVLAGLNRSVFQGTGEPLPPSFEAYPSFVAHGYFALLLAGFVILHVVAALYHQFVRNDGLFRRMWFGRRETGGAASMK